SPVHTIGNQIGEAISLHQNVGKAEARTKSIEMLKLVGFPNPEQRVDNYPHQLSGGLRQRAVSAMGLSCHPSLLIADEPTTALDVTTEAQILNLMRSLQQELGMAIMFITHNLGVVAQMTERVIVMYLGKVVEEADVDTIFHNPKHPYTSALLRPIPRLGVKTRDRQGTHAAEAARDSRLASEFGVGTRQRLDSISGTVPDPYSIPKGCPFHPRCSQRIRGVCDQQEPPNVEVE